MSEAGGGPGAFTPEQAAALESLYDDKEEWWAFLYALSDDVQERLGEAEAEGLRFLCLVEQRPFRLAYDGVRRLAIPPHAARWWVVRREPDQRGEYIEEDCLASYTDDGDYDNYLPSEFMPLNLGCYHEGPDEFNVFASQAAAITWFMNAWAGLSPEIRTELQDVGLVVSEGHKKRREQERGECAESR